MDSDTRQGVGCPARGINRCRLETGGSDRHPHDTPRPVLQWEQRVRWTCLDGSTSLKMEHAAWLTRVYCHCIGKLWPGCQICLLLCLTLSDLTPGHTLHTARALAEAQITDGDPRWHLQLAGPGPSAWWQPSSLCETHDNWSAFVISHILPTTKTRFIKYRGSSNYKIGPLWQVWTSPQSTKMRSEMLQFWVWILHKLVYGRVWLLVVGGGWVVQLLLFSFNFLEMVQSELQRHQAQSWW